MLVGRRVLARWPGEERAGTPHVVLVPGGGLWRSTIARQRVDEPRGKGASVAAAATVGVLAGAVAGATWAINKNMGKDMAVDTSNVEEKRTQS